MAPLAGTFLPTLFQSWLDFLKNVRRLSPHTFEAYKRDLEHFLTFLRHHGSLVGETQPDILQSLETLSLQDFRSWLAHRQNQGYQPRSTARALSVVRHFFKFLNQQYSLQKTALANVRSPKFHPSLPKALTPAQVKEVLDNITNLSEVAWIAQRDLALFTLLYSTGMRLGEALALFQCQAPLGDTLKIRGKGNKERLVPILPIVQQTTQQYLKLCPYQGDPNGPLFLGARGKRLQPAIAQKNLRHLRRWKNLPDFLTPHALRHSCATHLMGSSGQLREIQELLGHASLSTTQVYTHVDQEQLLKIYKKTHPRA